MLRQETEAKRCHAPARCKEHLNFCPCFGPAEKKKEKVEAKAALPVR